MKKTLMILLTLVLIGHATASHAQRGPCQPTPFNPGGCSWRGGGWGPGWDPYPGTRSGGQNAVLYANAVAVGLPAVVGAVGALANAITSALTAGAAYYDVELTDPGGKVMRFVGGKAQITAEVTR